LARKLDQGPHGGVKSMQQNRAPNAGSMKHAGNVIRDLICNVQSLLFDFDWNTQNSIVTGDPYKAFSVVDRCEPGFYSDTPTLKQFHDSRCIVLRQVH
jgi:hypothetical protein